MKNQLQLQLDLLSLSFSTVYEYIAKSKSIQKNIQLILFSLKGQFHEIFYLYFFS